MKSSKIFILLFAAFVWLLPTKMSGQFQQNINIYNQLKLMENSNPFPGAIIQIEMGSFNGTTGVFTGLTSTTNTVQRRDPATGRMLPFLEIVRPAVEKPVGVFTELRFVFSGINVPATLVVEEKSYTIAAGTTEFLARIDLNDREIEASGFFAQSIKWSIRFKSFIVEEAFRLRQFGASPDMAAGGFIIPYLPLSIIYQPSFDKNKRNYASYGETNGLGTTVSMGLEHGVSESVKPPFAQSSTYTTALHNGAVLFAGTGAGTLFAGLETMMRGLGSYSVQEETGTETSEFSHFKEETMQSLQVSTVPVEGLGRDDVFYFRKNVRCIWFVKNGRMTITPIADDGLVFKRAAILLAEYQALQNSNPEQAEDLKAMLELDPFIFGGALAALPAGRFVKMNTFEINNPVEYGVSNQTVNINTQSNSTYTFTTKDYKSGWLRYVGLSFDDKTIKTRITHSSTTSTGTTQSVAASLHLFCEPTETYTVGIYYDAIFRTFLVKKENPLPVNIIEGVLASSTGRGTASFQIIEFEFANGQKTTVQTNKTGQFVIRAGTTKATKGKIKINGKTVQEIDYKGQTIKNVKLKF